MGLFDMLKKVTFDEAVNMVLTNTVPEDEKGFNKFFKPISESSTAKMDAVVMLKFYRGYKGTDEEKARKAFNFLSGKLLGELSGSLDMNEENAAHSKAKIHILEQMLSEAEKA